MLSLANKYRPKSFDEVVGQDNIKTILQNQIKSGSIKQGYCFTGGAGTGKTTTARIFAKEINAGDVGEIIEIDAASNNGVDQIRELRDTCKFKPLRGGYKVYIIDEVHMLSTGAFNALLKTLEEPPEHCVFILCTTDPQKIPATILSRVQRFDFKRMTTQQIFDRLEHIVNCESENNEKLAVSVAAFEYIAKLSGGGMRDAISLLDTCLGYDSELTLEKVLQILGRSSYEDYIKLAHAIAEKDREKVLSVIDEVHVSGKDLRQFVKGFMEFVVDVEKYNHHSLEITSIPSIYKEELDWLIRYGLYDKTFDKLLKLNEMLRYDNSRALIEGVLISLC
jgi:DNA polymerase-3 subunit gamma/tau